MWLGVEWQRAAVAAQTNLTRNRFVTQKHLVRIWRKLLRKGQGFIFSKMTLGRRLDEPSVCHNLTGLASINHINGAGVGEECHF